MKSKNLELGRRINQVVSIIICAVLIPLFIIFLLLPSLLIPGYDYNEDAHLYLIYTILFIFFIALTIGINAIVKRYIKLSMEENVTIQQQPNQPIVQRSVNIDDRNSKLCSSCGEEILDKTGEFCSKCGAPIK